MGLINEYGHPFAYDENLKPGTKTGGTAKEGATGSLELQVRNHYFFQMFNIAINRFKYRNMPSEIQPYVAESFLLRNGTAAFVYDDIARKFAIMRLNLVGTLDIYDIPEERWTYANTGYIEEYGKDNSVVLYDKPILYPAVYDMQLYAQTMAKMWITRDLNILNLRMPFVAYGDSQTKIDWENIMRDVANGVPFIQWKPSLGKENLTILNTQAPILFPELSTGLRQIKVEYLSSIGIQCNPVEKKERMITGEAEGNQEEATAGKLVGLDVRKRAFKQVNDLWGSKLPNGPIEVEWNSGVDQLVDTFLSDPVAISTGIEGGAKIDT